MLNRNVYLLNKENNEWKAKFQENEEKYELQIQNII